MKAEMDHSLVQRKQQIPSTSADSPPKENNNKEIFSSQYCESNLSYRFRQTGDFMSSQLESAICWEKLSYPNMVTPAKKAKSNILGTAIAHWGKQVIAGFESTPKPNALSPSIHYISHIKKTNTQKTYNCYRRFLSPRNIKHKSELG